jgi:hypothetical protein
MAEAPVPVDRAQLSAWLAKCNPYEPLNPEDPRCHVFGSEEETRLRGGDPLEPLYDHITLSQGSSCQLFSGFSGTGKSTELGRLANTLEGKGYAVLRADARNYHDLSHELTIVDLMVVIAAAFGDATQRLVGEDVFRESYWRRLADFLQKDVQVTGVNVPIPTGLDLKLNVQHNQPFWLRAKTALASSPEKLREHSHSFIRQCIGAVRQKRSVPSGVVFCFDSLEKLNPAHPQFLDVMVSVVQVFTEFPNFLRLPDCHALYTISPYACLVHDRLSQHYDVSDVMPAVNAVQHGRAIVPNPAGIQALTQLLERRLPLDQIFGQRRDLLEKLILYSGGHIRTLIAFMRELLYRAARRGLPQTDADIEAIVQRTREGMEAALFRERLPLLAQILEHENINGIPEDQYPRLAAMMEDTLVLSYRNDKRWYAVHPLVRPQLVELLKRHSLENGTPQ